MFRLTIKELAAKKVRLLSTAMAVFLGVAFLAGTLVLTDTVTKTFDNILADAHAGTDAYARGDSPLSLEFGEGRPRIDAALVDELKNVDGVAHVAASVNGYAQLIDKRGNAVGDPQKQPLFGTNWVSVDELNPYRLVTGHAPSTPDEIVIDKHSADTADFVVGDRATVLTKGEPRTFTIAGIAKFGKADSVGGATSVLFTDATAQAVLSEPGKVDGIAFVAAEGISQAQLVANLDAVTGESVQLITGAELTAEDQQSIHENINEFGTFMLVFAAVAMFVGAFIINNTFSITVAQRTREMAMMRAIGASGRQVMRAVLVEAAAVGVIASAAGLAAGIAVASALKALLAAFGLDIPNGAAVVQTSTIVISMLVGMTVTLVSAALPARRASRIRPIAALREVAVDRSARSTRRTVAGFALTAAGVATLLAGLNGPEPALVGLGALVVYLGVSVLGPVLARPVAAVIGYPLRFRGMSGVLARENAMRNPKRTARTAASLMIGVGLVAFITIFAASVKTSVAGSFDSDYMGTQIVESGAYDSTTGISPEFAATLRTTPGVRTVSEARITRAEVGGSMVDALYGFDPHTIGTLFDLGHVEGSVDLLGADGLAVAADEAKAQGWALGDTVPVTFPSGTASFTVRAIFDNSSDWVGNEFVSVEAFAGNVPSQLDATVYVAAGSAAVVVDVAAGYPSVDVLDKQGFIDNRNADIDQVLALIYVMLALAIVIALLGIANTLALSIFERKRELGLLRAVGMTRSQVRASVRWESVIIAMFGTALGLGIGIFFGWAMVRAMAGEGVDVLRIPVANLLVVTAVAAIAGVGAAILPARRAAKLDVLKAVSSS